MIKLDYLHGVQGLNSALGISTVCIDPIKLNHKYGLFDSLLKRDLVNSFFSWFDSHTCLFVCFVLVCCQCSRVKMTGAEIKSSCWQPLYVAYGASVPIRARSRLHVCRIRDHFNKRDL